jgi:iron-sulfur cluster assembly accessory protein
MYVGEEMLTITSEAADAIKAIVGTSSDSQGLRVGLKDGGCAGHSYVLLFEAGPVDEDIIVEEDGAQVFVHPLHAPFLMGTVLCYDAKEFSSGFRLENPNVERMCGCGESFDFSAV